MSDDFSSKHYDLVAIDDALVDQFYECSDEHLTRHHIHKGDDTLCSYAEAAQHTQELTPVFLMAGGASANTATHMRERGARTAFCGILGRGENADIFRAALRQSGVDLYEIPSDEEGATGSCNSLITPDKERTMLTCLPTTHPLHNEDVDPALLRDTKFLLSQGYRWHKESRDALKHMFAITRAAGGKVAFGLASISCVEEYRADFLDLLHGKIDVLFSNEDEIHALYPGKSMEQITEELKTISASGQCTTIAITLGGHGSMIIDHGEIHQIAPVPPKKHVDTTGAGDAYAGGVLYGLTHNRSIDEAGALGSRLASKVIAHYGARSPAPSYTIDTNGSKVIPPAPLAYRPGFSSFTP